MSGNNGIHCDPSKRHDFVLLFDVSHGNPNGDPDADNLPRVDPETMHGIVTDVCLKRKVRDYAQVVLDKPIFIQSKVALNRLIQEGFKKVGYEAVLTELSEEEQDDENLIAWLDSKADAGFSIVDDSLAFAGEKATKKFIQTQLLADLPSEDKELKDRLQKIVNRLVDAAKSASGIDRAKQQEAQDQLRRDYYDIKLFGAVLQTGLNAGQVRGPMQFTFARSLEPIVPLDWTITRQARTTSERMLTGQTEMGRKPFVPYGLYLAKGFYSPHLNQRTDNGKVQRFAAEQDLADFWDALCRMFNFDHSASKGEMYTRAVYVFTHEDSKGNAASHKLFRLVEQPLRERVAERQNNRENGPHPSPPRSIEDYEPLPTKEDIKKALDEQNVNGVSIEVLSE